MSSGHDFLKGIHTILVTPFNDDYSLNLDGHRKNVDFAAGSNVHALACLGSQGEFHSLGIDEQKQVMRVTVEACAGRKPVICGATHSGTHEAEELARHARDIGADAVLVTPPYYAQVTREGVYEHFARIARNVGLPIVLYNAPDRTGFNLTPDFLAKLAEIDQVIAVKQASRNILELEETVTQVGDRLAIFCGSEAMIWPCLSLGMVGSSSTAASFMPQYFVDIYEAGVNGKWREGRALFLKLAMLRRLFGRLGQGAVVKAAMDRIGLVGGPVRPPLVTPSREELAELDTILLDLKIGPAS